MITFFGLVQEFSQISVDFLAHRGRAAGKLVHPPVSCLISESISMIPKLHMSQRFVSAVSYLTLPVAVLDFLAAAALFHLLKLLAATGALLHCVLHGVFRNRRHSLDSLSSTSSSQSSAVCNSFLPISDSEFESERVLV